jgi:hypothetical protein
MTDSRGQQDDGGGEGAPTERPSPPSFPAPGEDTERRSSPLSDLLVGWPVSLGANLPYLIAIFTSFCNWIVHYFTRQWMKNEMEGNPGTPIALSGTLLVAIAVLAMIGGLLYAAIGPWWFQKRVIWSGGDVDAATARSSYFATLLPYTLAVGAIAALNIATAGSDTAEWLETTLTLLSIGALFASCLWLYWIARQAFGVRRGPGIVLLIALPWLWYALINIAGLAAGFVGAMQAEVRAIAQATADNNTPGVHFAGSPDTPMELTAPRGWSVEAMPRTEDDPSWGVSVDASDGSYLLVIASIEPIAFDEWVRETTRDYRDFGVSVVPTGTLTSIGSTATPRSGEGTTFALRSEEGDGRLTLFIAEAPDQGWIMFQIVVPEPDITGSAAAIQRMIDSLVVRW